MQVVKLPTKRAGTITSMILIVAPAFVASLHGQANPGMPEKQAEGLLRTYLRSRGYDTKGVKLDIELEQGAETGAASGFYLYDVYVDTPQRLVTIGSYGVGRRTGELWERTECRRIQSDAVAPLQKRMRESSGLSPGELKHLQTSNPCFDAARRHGRSSRTQ